MTVIFLGYIAGVACFVGGSAAAFGRRNRVAP
jgi:hypothetical protein